MDVMHGSGPKRAVRTVDFANRLLNLTPELLVRLHLFARRHRDLDVPDLIGQRGILDEQPLDGLQPPRYALRVIEPVDPKQDPTVAGIAPDGLRFRLHAGLTCEAA